MIPGITHWDLLGIEKPSRYVGGEVNQALRKPDAALTVCLAFPDIYELGMSNIAIKILYEILNLNPLISVERVFSPWIDFESLLRKKNISLSSLESKTPIGEFDILGITLPYEMTFTNVLNLLNLGKIPLHGNLRKGFPLIIGGGPSASNPLPLSNFFDAILIGEGEEAFPQLCSLVINAKKEKAAKQDILKEIRHIEGFWVPTFPGPVRRRVFKGFATTPPPLKPPIPLIDAIHNRAPIEIFRGCIQGCRFCHAGFFYRPKRERKLEDLAIWGKELLKNTGDETLGLVSLSTSDYSDLNNLIAKLECEKVFPDQTLSIPSLRMNDKTIGLLNASPHIKKGGLTFAPEAGSQRLRDIIHKRITEDEILNVVMATKESCYRTVKLYFMIGLPFENDSDIDAIPDLIYRIEDAVRRNKLRKDLSISLSGFVPKPFTPFQWCPQIDSELLRERRARICQALKKSRAKISWRDEFLCLLEGVISRGDEKVGRLIQTVYDKGSRFDGWSDQFHPHLWKEAFQEIQLDPRLYTRERDIAETLPWHFVDFQVPNAFFEAEYRKAAKIAG